MTLALQRSLMDQGGTGLSHSRQGGMPPCLHKEYNERKDTRGHAPSDGGLGVSPRIKNRLWVGGWEEQRPCSGDRADAPHRAQRPSTTSCNEAQAAKGVIGRATCLPAGILPAELSERVQTVESSWSFR